MTTPTNTSVQPGAAGAQQRIMVPPPGDPWAGQAASYDGARPMPPSLLVDILTQFIRTPHPDTVVDLGSGTGLSTVIWGGRAQRVVGIEPNEDMRAQAMRRLATSPHAASVCFHAGAAHRTDFPDASVDIATCAQSFHWMEPVATLAEVARVLRPGGLFAAYDYDWPPLIDWELDRVYQDFDQRLDALTRERRGGELGPRWPKDQHLVRVRASGHFRLVREIVVHHQEQGDADRYIGLIMSGEYGHQSRLGTVTAREVEFDRLEQAAHRRIGSTPVPWYFSYRAILAVR
jgi:ubiquinone/menaquinone biosynthesis C-methylase UbiE